MLGVLGEAALRTLLLAGLVQAAVWALRLRPARLLLAAWTILLVASLGMPVLPLLAPMHIPVHAALPEPLAGSAAELLQHAAPSATHTPETPERPTGPAWPPLETLYGAVAAAFLLRVAVGVGLSLRLLLRSVPLHRGGAGPRVRISRDVTGPVTVARTILLPPDAVAWPAATWRAVLAHERAHVARWDFALLVLSQLNRALFWFSPLSWWLHRRLVALTEMASDDQAMAVTGDRLGYAEILLAMGRRSGPVARGPAMARPATLRHRIDRILRDQRAPHRTGGSQQAVLAAGVAALSLAVASLTAGPITDPAPGPAAASPPPPEPPSPARPLPQPTLATPAIARPAAAPSPTAPPLRAAPRPPPGPLAKTLPPRTPPRLTAPTQARPTELAAPSPQAQHAPTPAAADPAAAEPPTIQSSFEGIAGTTCAGIVTVGQRAAGGMLSRPNVVPGQSVPARAQFFRKDSGVLWVRFDVFERPPLDLPVRFTRNGMTWTGEYGIAYTVQPAGGNRLAGLAAPVAADSARLDFACGHSTRHAL